MASLISPSDYKKMKEQAPPEQQQLTEEQIAEYKKPLTKEETRDAVQELVNSDFLKRFPKRDLKYADPVLDGQLIALHSFVPSSGAKPDEDGIYGMIKVRGCFTNQQDASEWAEELIRDYDTYHSIEMSYVGKPFPISKNPDKYLSKDNITEIDIRKKIDKSMKDKVKEDRRNEKKIKKEIEEQEERLKEDVDEDMDPQDRYIELVVKMSHLTFTYIETRKKMDEMKSNILKTRDEIHDLDSQSDEYKKHCMEIYMKARERSGIKNDDNSFIRYMDQALAEEELGF